MEENIVQFVAGSIASLLFALGTVGMLVKAIRTKDLKSYSLTSLVTTAAGNMIYWIYIASLPFGPIWLLHGFYTASTFLMLAWLVMYRRRPRTTRRITRGVRRITQTIELPRLIIKFQ